jgi:hypothetical protein
MYKGFFYPLSAVKINTAKETYEYLKNKQEERGIAS